MQGLLLIQKKTEEMEKAKKIILQMETNKNRIKIIAM
jgi:hypothetical protein